MLNSDAELKSLPTAASRQHAQGGGARSRTSLGDCIPVVWCSEELVSSIRTCMTKYTHNNDGQLFIRIKGFSMHMQAATSFCLVKDCRLTRPSSGPGRYHLYQPESTTVDATSRF